jgi:SOS response regulatory protein OraA/RecX
VESRDRAHPRGERALQRELSLKGIDRSIIEAVLADRDAGPDRGAHEQSGRASPADRGADEPADERAAERLLARKASTLARIADPRRRRQRAYELLVRNGFESSVAASAAERSIRADDGDGD